MIKKNYNKYIKISIFLGVKSSQFDDQNDDRIDQN